VRNYLVYDGFLPLNSNVGWALYAANHPIQGKRFEPLNLPKVPAEWQGLNEVELNSRLTAAGILFVVEEPGRFALQTLDRFRNYFRFWPEPTSSPIANVSRVLSFGLYLPFMLYGLVLSIRFVREPGYGSGLMPGAAVAVSRARRLVSLLYLYVAVYSAIHLLSWAMHRYRLPVDAVMMVFVGLAVVDLWRRFERWRSGRQGSGIPVQT
jgi:fumarate reductase subunit D